MKKFHTIIILLNLANLYTENSLDWNPATYHKHAQRQRTVTLTYLDYLQLTGNEKILDVGCGNGKISATIAQMIPDGQIVATDISEPMISFAQKKFAHIKNLTFSCIDATALNLENEFDRVISFFCIHWIKNKSLALAAMIKALKNNGSLFILATINDEKQPIVESYKKVMQKNKWMPFFTSYEWPLYLVNSQKTTQTLKKLGCSVIFSKIVKKFNRFSSKQQFINHLKALPLALDCLTQELRPQFLEEVIEEYLKLYPINKDGSINYLCPYCIIQAQK